LSPDPYDPRHQYDYKVPYEQGQGPSWQPEHGQFRWPDTGKNPGYDTYQYMQQQLNQNPDLNQYRDAMAQYYQQDPKRLLSLLADFIPGVGQGKGVQEGAMGTDLLTGEQIPTWARVLGLLSALPVVGGVGGMLKDVGKVGKGAKGAEDILAPIKKMSKAKAAYDKAAEAAGRLFGGANTADMDKLVDAVIPKKTPKVPKKTLIPEKRAMEILDQDIERGFGPGRVQYDPESGMYQLTDTGGQGNPIKLSPDLMQQISQVPKGDKYPNELTSSIIDYLGKISPQRGQLFGSTKEAILDLTEHPDVRKAYVFGSGTTDKIKPKDVDLGVEYVGRGPGTANPDLGHQFMKAQNKSYNNYKQVIPAGSIEEPPLHIMQTTGDFQKTYPTLQEFGMEKYGSEYNPIRIAGGIPPALLLSELIRRSYGSGQEGTPSQ
jgi:hypothetical protein